jgi:tRNA (guanine37-N1)-methyltransferase
MKKDLKKYLNKSLETCQLEQFYSSYEVVGDIAILRVHKSLENRIPEIADIIMTSNKHIKTILHQTSPVTSSFRIRKLRWIAGDKKTETIHKEYGCSFKLDLEKTYFSPRLHFERMRIAKQVKPHEVVINMFSGVGCFSILMAKHVKPKKVFSIDINPEAIKYAQKNVKLNKVRHIVESLEGDAKLLIETKLQNIADRVLMPLPEKAFEYLKYAVSALKRNGGDIHYYDFTHARKSEKPVIKISEKVSRKLRKLNINSRISFGKVVRTIGPRWFQIVLDIHIFKKS